jgi:sugar phosphate isomerase/epimerase
MRLSVSAWSVQKNLFGKRAAKMSLKEFIDICKKENADGVELLDCFWETPEHAAETKAYCDSIGMPVSAYSIGNSFVRDDEGRKKEIAKVKEGIDMAVFLQTKLLRVFSGDLKDGLAFEACFNMIVESYKECVGYAREKGVVMVLENHGLLAGKSGQVKDIIEAVGSEFLQANADTGNFILVGEKPLDAVKNLGGLVKFVHFKDMKKDENGVYPDLQGVRFNGTVIGAGECDVKGVADYLRKTGYDGWLSIEFEGEGDSVEGTVASIRYTRAII